MVQGLGLEQAAQLNLNGYAPGLTHWWRSREADTHVVVVEARAKRESSLDMSRQRCMSFLLYTTLDMWKEQAQSRELETLRVGVTCLTFCQCRTWKHRSLQKNCAYIYMYSCAYVLLFGHLFIAASLHCCIDEWTESAPQQLLIV